MSEKICWRCKKLKPIFLSHACRECLDIILKESKAQLEKEWQTSTDGRVYSFLKEHGETIRKTICINTGIESSTTYNALVRLEIRGLVSRKTGKVQSINGEGRPPVLWKVR
jgi:predicted ArsR family transcriptional regulator